MFRLSSFAFTKLIPVLSPSRSLSKLTHSRLWPLHRPVAALTMRFYASFPEKSNKPHGIKNIGLTNSFEIRSIRFTINISEFVDSKIKFVSIRECGMNDKQHLNHLWISIPAAHTLLEQVDEVSKKLDRNNVESLMKEQCLSRFFDEEANRVIELRIDDEFGSIVYLQVHQSNLYQDKGSSVFIPLDGITTFQQKLSATLRNCEKKTNPNRQKSFKDICKSRSFAYEHKRYFLQLKRSNMNGDVLVQLGELNRESNKKRNMFVPIDAARTLFGLLLDAYKAIQRDEGHLQRGKPLDILYKKCFTHEDKEFTVRVDVSETEMRRLGDMCLWIRQQRLDNETLQNFIIIRSRGVHLLLKHYEDILQEYDCLKPTLIDAYSPECSDKEKQLKQSSNQEITALKTECEPKVTDLKDRKSAEENSRSMVNRKEIPKKRT